MDFDAFQIENVRRETRQELLAQLETSKSGSPQSIAATVELARRDEITDFIRFWVGFTVAALSLIVGTVMMIRYLWV